MSFATHALLCASDRFSRRRHKPCRVVPGIASVKCYQITHRGGPFQSKCRITGLARDLKRTCDERASLRCQCVLRNPQRILRQVRNIVMTQDVRLALTVALGSGASQMRDLPCIISALAKPWHSTARDFSAPVVRGLHTCARRQWHHGAGTMHDGVRIALDATGRMPTGRPSVRPPRGRRSW